MFYRDYRKDVEVFELNGNKLGGFKVLTYGGDISFLLGKTLSEIHHSEDEIVFITECNHVLYLYHSQNCCEQVSIESIVGDLDDLVGNTVLLAECVTNCDDEVGTYTFYKLATVKGYVDIRWLGESNGYYSEEVDCFIGYR